MARIRTIKRSYGWSVGYRLSSHPPGQCDWWIWTSESGNEYAMPQLHDVQWERAQQPGSSC